MDEGLLITVVIPTRMTESASVTLDSLATQTFQGFTTIVIPDQGKGANWARNEGFKQVKTEFVLFSDNDIEWKSRAFETMLRVIKGSRASYCYGRYIIRDEAKNETHVWCHQAFDANLLKKSNYISTMSLIRTKDFCGFDESIKRLQDWDVWLSMLEQGKQGVYCEDLIFETKVRIGITHSNKSYDQRVEEYANAVVEVKKKYNLCPHLQ